MPVLNVKLPEMNKFVVYKTVYIIVYIIYLLKR